MLCIHTMCAILAKKRQIPAMRMERTKSLTGCEASEGSNSGRSESGEGSLAWFCITPKAAQVKTGSKEQMFTTYKFT